MKEPKSRAEFPFGYHHISKQILREFLRETIV
jgi:hypothetical protein